MRRSLHRQHPVVEFDNHYEKSVNPVEVLGEEVFLEALDVDLDEERLAVETLFQQFVDRHESDLAHRVVLHLKPPASAAWVNQRPVAAFGGHGGFNELDGGAIPPALDHVLVLRLHGDNLRSRELLSKIGRSESNVCAAVDDQGFSASRHDLVVLCEYAF